MTFSHPWILAAAPVLLVLVVIGLVRFSRRRRRLADFLGGRRAAARLGRTGLYRLPVRRMLLLGLASLLLAGAAAGPQWRGASDPDVEPSPEPPPPSVVLAIDISASMQADDGTPTRLAQAAAVARDLLPTLEDARVGLVLFSGTPYTLAPPTRDHAVLEYLLAGITPDLVNIYDPGSLPSAVLREATRALTELPDSAAPRAESGEDAPGPATAASADSAVGASSRAEAPGSRSLVLIGDGEAGEPVEAIREAAATAAEEGIRIHTVGVGTPEGGRMLLPAGYRRKGLDGRGPRGPMATRLQASTLREMAEIGNGFYAHAADVSALDRIRRTLAAPEPSPEPEAAEAGRPLWALLDPATLFVALALLALMAEGLMDLPARRAREARPWTRSSVGAPSPTAGRTS